MTHLNGHSSLRQGNERTSGVRRYLEFLSTKLLLVLSTYRESSIKVGWLTVKFSELSVRWKLELSLFILDKRFEQWYDGGIKLEKVL